MPERFLRSSELAAQHREAVDRVVLAVVAHGGDLPEIEDALGALGINFEVSQSVINHLKASRLLKLDPRHGPSLTEAGRATLSKVGPEDNAHALGELTVRRRQEMTRLGKAILEQLPREERED